ncbi:single-stranded DNA-binding protein [Desemzia sp. C1]|uniref:single-stranded DNA-binding protein n=1 Tax=Desemzia sp. C1 TaxID=2892016 RepID=UPI001E3FE876|nr:single-stranded DNA-binding protein [Desemzia sp. C1]MCI3029829.1 single-stranded DNA-binding protein [Desemzia sp. C1]
MNAVHLLGRLTKELEVRYTSNGKAVANGTLATARYSKGEKKADFIPFVIWDKQAENLANFTKKGSKIAINGSIQTRSYDNTIAKERKCL